MAKKKIGQAPAVQSKLDPAMEAAALFQLAQNRPDLWPDIILHPNAYPGLLDWFKNIDQPPVQAALAKRAATQQPQQPQPRSGAAPFIRPGDAPRPNAGSQPAGAARPSVAPKPAAPQPVKRPSALADPPRGGTPSATFRKPVGKAQAAPKTPKVVASPQAAPTPNARPASSVPAVDDKTVLARRRRLGYLTFNDETVVLTKKRVMIGRKLRGLDDTDDVQLVRVADETKTISGTHAELEYGDSGWMVKDLDSTNGVYVVDKGGEEKLIETAAPAEGTFYLGDVKFGLSKGPQANG